MTFEDWGGDLSFGHLWGLAIWLVGRKLWWSLRGLVCRIHIQILKEKLKSRFDSMGKRRDLKITWNFFGRKSFIGRPLGLSILMGIISTLSWLAGADSHSTPWVVKNWFGRLCWVENFRPGICWPAKRADWGCPWWGCKRKHHLCRFLFFRASLGSVGILVPSDSVQTWNSGFSASPFSSLIQGVSSASRKHHQCLKTHSHRRTEMRPKK